MVRILLAEDEEVLRMLVVDTLVDEGYEVDEACDGEEAMQFIHDNDYDLIILDYMMPVLTGLEVTERIRKLSDATKQQVKIMILTAKSQKADQERALAAGANYFITKPFSPIKLVETIGEIISG